MGSPDHFIFHSSSGTQGSSFGCFHDSIKNIDDHISGVVTCIVINFGKIRNHVGSFTTIGNHVVDSGFLWNVLSHHVYHSIHGFHTIQCGSSFIRCSSRVGRNPIKPEFGRLIGQSSTSACSICGTRVPVKRHIHIIKNTLADHVYFP